jgi:hypothetical protein
MDKGVLYGLMGLIMLDRLDRIQFLELGLMSGNRTRIIHSGRMVTIMERLKMDLDTERGI